MAKKEAAHNSKLYLRILGIIEIVLAALSIILMIIFMMSNITLTEMGISGQQISDLAAQNISESTFKTIVGITGIVIGILDALIGWLLIRAANNPKKSTFVLVLVVLMTVTSIVTLFTSGFSSIGTVIGNITSVTVNVLALMSLFRIRSENN
ncbi:hypothetical protein IKE84_01180 [Candidatus Saccharibacteria bacterium]|nr:hypothetical protein [Candidatus Saccharibacteria bacterium]